MGGLIRRSSNSSREGVPGLGDLPLIGGLFSNDSKNITTTEIVVLLTPRIVDFEKIEVEQMSLINVETLERILIEEQLQIEAKMRKIMDDQEFDPERFHSN